MCVSSKSLNCACAHMQASAVCLRAPVSESLSRLQRDQLQKFAQYLISELPQQVTSTSWISCSLVQNVINVMRPSVLTCGHVHARVQVSGGCQVAS